VTSEYVFFGGKRIARRDASNNIYYYAEDFIGSSRVMTTSNGTVCYEADFYPYGGERTITNTCPQNYKFQGKERDAETGNDDFGARYYSSSFGRWLSPDWSAIPAPVPYADLTNPQTLNLYQFVKNDPETFTDPDGHNECGPTCPAGLFNNAGGNGAVGPNPDTSLHATLRAAGATINSIKMVDEQEKKAAEQAKKNNQSAAQALAKQKEPYSLAKGEEKPDPNGNGGIIQSYQVVDAHGKPVQDVAVQEHIKVLAAENAIPNPNPDPVYSPTGQIEDRIGPHAPPGPEHVFLKTEQTWTAYKGGHKYELSTKVIQYVSITNRRVTAHAEIVVP
jgi:RHS repeat-associated protein